MKDFYFPHAISAASDEKVLKLRVKFGNAEGYGMWWMLLEHMARNDGYIDGSTMAELSISYGISHEKWKEYIAYCEEISLLHRSKNGLFSHRMNEHLGFRKERSESGKKGAKSRWGSQEQLLPQPMAKPLAQPIAGKERKGEERKEIKKPTKKADDETPVPNREEERTPERQQQPDDVIEKEFFETAKSEQWCDETYAAAKQTQLHGLSAAGSVEVLRKMRVCLNALKSPGESTRKLAKKMYGEIVGLIQDRGLDEKTLDGKALAKRRKFAQQEIGGQNAEDEVGDVFNVE